MNRLALFDCDGTLVDSGAQICTAMTACFESHALAPPSPAATRRVVGLSLVEAMRALHPAGDEAAHASLAASYRTAFQRMRAEGQVEEPLYDGIERVLATLEAAGWLLGVATGKSDRGLALCLERHGLAARFVTLQTADRHPSKPDPAMVHAAIAEAGAAPATTIVIGDTSFDMLMARAAGARAVGVAWGYHPPHELTVAGAEAIAEKPADLPALLEMLA